MGGVTANPPRNGEGDRAKRGGGGSPPTRRPEVYEARKLRRAMSPPEVLLWQRLRGSPQGVKFRRQHPIGSYTTDFYCGIARLVIEVDGEVHSRGAQPIRDQSRDAFLRDNGYQLCRVPASEVLRNPDEAAAAILALAAAPLHQPAAGPPPRAGEDQGNS